MPDNPLKIIATEKSSIKNSPISPKSARFEWQAKMERLWLTNPEQFNPLRNAIERERIAQLKELIHALPSPGTAVDLGCGFGEVSRTLQKAGWKVQALDIASNALKAFVQKGKEGIELIQDALPSTKLQDDAYDLVICTEVIAYLQERDYRLLMAELSRLVKREGLVICSTGIDINSEDALQRFGALAETEFKINQWIFNHHLLLLRLQNFFESPMRYVLASKNNEERNLELKARHGISRGLYRLNTSKIGGCFWLPLKWILTPIVHILNQNRAVMKFLEKICRLFWDESGISHALFVGTRRPLIMPTKADLESQEPKGKRQVWE